MCIVVGGCCSAAPYRSEFKSTPGLDARVPCTRRSYKSVKVHESRLTVKYGIIGEL